MYVEFLLGDCLEVMRGMADDTFDLAFGSPPYEDARTYGIDFNLKGQAWVDWMIPQVVEACRVTNGLVIVNAAGKVKQFRYSPVVEWLVSDLTRKHGIVCGPAPYVFQRVGIPGSGGPHYHRRDWEPIYAFAKPESLPPRWSNNLAMGKPPKYAPGGKMSHRLSDGTRRNHDKADAVGYDPPAIANPGNVIHLSVGGGRIGHELAHENEAPFPEALAEWFILSYCPLDGTVLDPWSGSGTTACVAYRLGRNGTGIDIRESQCEIGRRRFAEAQPELFGAIKG